MAIRNDFAPGEVLAAADLNDTFASKVDYPSGGADGNVLTKSGTSAAWAAVTSGLVLVSTDTFSAVSSFSLANSTFTSTYEHYRVLVRGSASTTADLNLRFRASGTDNSSTIYYWGFEQFRTSNAFASTGGGGTNLPIVGKVSSTGGYRLAFDVLSPQLAEVTTLQGLMSATDATNTYAGKYFISTPLNALQFDALTLIASTGTITGHIDVYGYSL